MGWGVRRWALVVGRGLARSEFYERAGAGAVVWSGVVWLPGAGVAWAGASGGCGSGGVVPATRVDVSVVRCALRWGARGRVVGGGSGVVSGVLCGGLGRVGWAVCSPCPVIVL